jgi:peptidoglycan hydrolase CwlO-like protein
MRKTLKTLGLAFLVTGGLLTSCNSSSEKKSEQNSDTMEQAEQAMEDAKRGIQEEWEKFRSESESWVKKNEDRISEMREKGKSDKTFKEKYKEAVDDLEKKNESLKARLNDARTDTRENWQEFKREWDHDMESLQEAFNDLGKNNAK